MIAINQQKSKQMEIWTFIKAYVKSMRLYYSFITGIAGWIGVSYYQFIAHSTGPIGKTDIVRTIEVATPISKQIVILVILFLAWGINQIVNDFLGLKEDKINAPMRPMVTGELHPWASLGLSAFLMLCIFCITWIYLEPIALIPLVIGAILNVRTK